MTKLFGESSKYLLFTDGTNAVVIDKEMNMVDSVGALPLLASARPWKKERVFAKKHQYDLASGALADLKVQVLVASGRMYTIPKSVQAEAKKALEWHKEHHRGGTPVGMGTARTLAEGGQIGIQKVRHIAKYFPRHEVDKKGKGWKPGDDNFPSNGRIAWALWGGDAGWSWARSIVERENKKAVRADGYVVEFDGSSIDDYEMPASYDADLSVFEEAKTYPHEMAPEFVGRTFEDGSGIDRLYMISPDGLAKVWDDGAWDDLGLPDSDIDAYDKALDDDHDVEEKSHILLDPDSALIISAYLQASPFVPVSVYDINDEEAELVLSAMEDIDWTMSDAVLTAAGAAAPDSTPGKYTTSERAKNAKTQVRDKGGKFASKGSRVVVGGDAANGSGSITKINAATKSVTVKLDNGQTIDVSADQTQKAEDFAPTAVETPFVQAPLDTSGILGQPRAPIDQPKAKLPNGLPALTGDQLGQMLADWPAWVKSQRDSQQQTYTPPTKAETAKERAGMAKDIAKKSGIKPFDGLGDVRQHPLYKNLFKNNPKLNLYYDYTPMKADGAPSSTKTPVAPKTAKPGTKMSPETSDVQPAYMAIVSPEDPTAVFDLVAVVPASSTSTAPMTYKRQDAKWVQDEQILSDLQSPTPPPVVPLAGDVLIDTLKQIDNAVTASANALVADVGNKLGNKAKGHVVGAERLRIYWTVGKGALKIRWNTPGDWTRCYRHLRKYMGLRAKGYCSLRHKEMTGTWPGSKYNIGNQGKMLKASAWIPSEDEFLDVVYLNARMNDAKARVMVASADMNEVGTSFTIPLVIPEGVESGDGRKFSKGSIEYRELPLPLMWQIKTADGHDGSVVVGRIDKMERIENGIGNARGVFDTGAYGKEAERLVREGFIRGVSADLDKFEASEKASKKDAADDDSDKKIGGGKININKARVMAVTIVPKPAFQECRIYLENNTDAGESQEDTVNKTPDGIYAEDMGDEAMAIVACGMIASSIPTVPPATWFTNPQLTGPTPLTVDDHGRVFGHIASWNVNHIGMTAGTRPPRSKSRYAYFHTGVIRADDNKDYPVGQLTLAGGHASLEASALDAARHYDDTGSAIADVHAGEDAHGIWVAGALRPSASPEQIRALRASAPSGDWRPINGALELVAVCQVNVPGFPIARARVASGQVYALVAAGAQVLARMKSDPIAELTQRLEAIENKEKTELSAKMAELSTRVKGQVTMSNEEPKAPSVNVEELKARVASANAEAELAAISMKARQRLAKEGKALPDGSFPIRNEGDLKNAIHAYGRSKESDRAKVRRHIVKRARGLGKPELIPDEWKSASVVAEDAADLRAQVAAARAVVENTEENGK